MDHYDILKGVNVCASHFSAVVIAEAFNALKKDFPDLFKVDLVRVLELLIRLNEGRVLRLFLS